MKSTKMRIPVLLMVAAWVGLWGLVVLKLLGLLPTWSWWQATAPMWLTVMTGGLIAFCLACDLALKWVDKVSA